MVQLLTEKILGYTLTLLATMRIFFHRRYTCVVYIYERVARTLGTCTLFCLVIYKCKLLKKTTTKYVHIICSHWALTETEDRK